MVLTVVMLIGIAPTAAFAQENPAAVEELAEEKKTASLEKEESEEIVEHTTPVNLPDNNDGELAPTGQCGDNVYWTFDESTGTLNISGTGDMYEKTCFKFDESIKTVKIESGVTSIGDWTFEYCTNLTSVVIPNSVTSIGSQAFYDCNCLTSIEIPDSVTSIGDGAFIRCKSIEQIIIPNGVKRIGENAFAGCESLKNITILDGLKEIDYNVFGSCISLKSITIPESVARIDIGAFCDCPSIIEFIVSPNNKNYCSDDSGILFSKDKTVLVKYTTGSDADTYTVPNSVKRIEPYAFEEGTNLKKVKMSEGVKTIGYNAFEDCYALETVVIPRSVSDIEEFYIYHAFSNCEKLIIQCYENSYAFQYAIDYDIPFVIIEEDVQTIVDNVTGIKIYVEPGTYNGEVTMKVMEVLSGSSFVLAGKVENASSTKIFSIKTFVDGQEVQPNEYVTVKIPVPAGFNASRCKIYYLDVANDTTVEMPVTVEGNYLVFKTNHFSDWAVIETKASIKSVSLGDRTIDYKSSANLNPQIVADEGAKYSVSYKSSNPSVVSVDQSGKVTSQKQAGFNQGSATITCTVTDSNGNTVQDTCKVSVQYAWWQWLIKILLFGWIWY